MARYTSDLRSGSHEGCRWCSFILAETVRSTGPLVEGWDETVEVELKLSVNMSNARDELYPSLWISNTNNYLYASESELL